MTISVEYGFYWGIISSGQVGQHWFTYFLRLLGDWSPCSLAWTALFNKKTGN